MVCMERIKAIMKRTATAIRRGGTAVVEEIRKDVSTFKTYIGEKIKRK